MSKETIICLIILILAGLILEFLTKGKRQKYFAIFVLSVFWAIMAMRRSIEVPDTDAYINYTEALSIDMVTHGFFHIQGQYEIGFEFLTKIILCLGLKYRAVFCVLALLISLLGAEIFSDIQIPIVAWLIFISFYGMYFSFIVLRAGLSIMFFACFVKHVKMKKTIACISLIFSILFHYSAFAALFIYIISLFIKERSLKKDILWICIFFILYIFSFGNHLTIRILTFMDKFLDFPLWNRFIFYLTNFKTNPFDISFRLVFNIVIYLCGLKLQHKNRIILFTNKLVFLGLVCSLFFGTNTVIGRIVDFVLIFNVFNIILVLKSLMPHKNTYLTIKNTSWIFNETRSSIAYKIDKSYLAISLFFILINLVFIIRIII